MLRAESHTIRKDSLLLREEIQTLRKELRDETQLLRNEGQKFQQSLLKVLPKSYALTLSTLLTGMRSERDIYAAPEPLTSLDFEKTITKKQVKPLSSSRLKQPDKMRPDNQRSLLQSAGSFFR